MKNRLTQLIPQLVCVAIAMAWLYPTWDQTTVGRKVFGVMWLSFIFGIIVGKRGEHRAPEAS